jgi:hypothetical protein
VLDGNPVFVHGPCNQARYKYRIAAAQKRTPGKQTITFDLAYDGGSSIARGLGASVASAELASWAMPANTVLHLDEAPNKG